MPPRRTLALGNFFSAIHFYLIVYVIAPYLATFMPADKTGLVVALGAVGTLAAFPLMPKLAGTYGAKRASIGTAFVVGVGLFILANQPPFWLAALALAFVCATSPFIQYFLDLLLEATNAAASETGRVRTAFITAGNVALIAAPLLIGWLLDSGNEYWRVFLVAGISLAPFIALFSIEKLPEGMPAASHPKLIDTCKCMVQDVDLRAASFGNLVLQLFYHLAPLYIPLYLHSVLGIAWSELGWMFMVMLLPFVLLEYPAGYIADRWLGDKELLTIGFIIIGVAFGALGFVTSTTPLYVIVLILVTSRIGAALVEAMVEGHFFRRVSAEDVNTVSVYRMARPLSALIAPVTASIVLVMTESYFVFFVTSALVLIALGVLSARQVQDIR